MCHIILSVPKILTNFLNMRKSFNLPEFLSKIEPYVLPAILILVGLTAFGLGRLSVEVPAECSTLQQ